jgi:hypothetical protein
MFYVSAANIVSILAKGTAYQSLNMNAGATVPQWQASLQSILTVAGDIIYTSAANTPARLAKGSALQVLRMNAAGTFQEYASVAIPDVTAGTTTTLASSLANKVIVGTGYAKSKEIYIGRTGVVTATFSLAINYGAIIALYGLIYINSVANGSEQTTGSSGTFSQDFTVVTGDLVQLYTAKGNLDYGGSCSGFIITCTDPMDNYATLD